ncbi:hypothetical protein EW026_g4607 [Hermanssonia centrifuga]|uniref:Uncharacterized protein n=1 Tax=Hermanssonia centrifuga TaxID=98765 RepID=A0A4S4KL59_9APHY|nr:hypothetical protein EW026_g4607 [Hermanssonia centrifuga]
MLTILPIVVASYVFASPLEKRVTVSDIGDIISPTDGSSITPGTPFSFQYADGYGAGCYAGYTSIDVWLVDHEPTGSDLNSTYQFPDGNFLYHFGSYTIINFIGLPPGVNPSPPSTLTLPDPLDAAYDNQEPLGSNMYGLTSNNLQYSP